MNFNYYIYGTPGGHYCQWPDDYTSALFGQQAESVRGSQALIHRKNSLYYYALTERLDDGNTIGLALVLNNAQTPRPLSLFAMMRQILKEEIPSRGKLLQYNTSGQLHFSIGHMSEASEEYQWLGEYLEKKLDDFGHYIPFSSPEVAYDGCDSRIMDDMDAATDDSVHSLTNNYNTVELASAASTTQSYVSRLIAQMNDKIAELEREKAEKEIELKRTIKKKKQYSLVVILLLILLLGGAGAAYIIRGDSFTIGSLEENVSQLNEELYQEQDAIHQHQIHIAKLQDTVVRQLSRIEQLSDSLKQKEQVLSRYASLQYTVGMPTVDSNSFDEGYSMWLYAVAPITIESIALRAKSAGYADIVLRDDDGKYVSSETVYVSTHFSQKTVNLKMPSSGYYTLSIETSDISLQYSQANSDTYRTMGSGPLRIIGCCESGRSLRKARQDNYRYFYSIKYRVDMRNGNLGQIKKQRVAPQREYSERHVGKRHYILPAKFL